LVKLKAAVIGAGWAGKMHAQAYKISQNADLIGVSDISEERAKVIGEELGVFHTTDYEALIKKGAQIVSIATPPFAHFEITKSAMERGVHVLVEKPITLDLDEAQELVELADQSEAKLMVGFSERFHVGFSAVKKRMKLIGKPYMARGWWMHRASSSKGWIWDVKKSGGAIVDLGIFLIDLFRWFFNSEVRMVECRSGNFVFEDADSEDSALMMLKFKNEAFASIDVSRILPDSFPSSINVGMDIFGSQGCMKVDTTTSLPLQVFTKEEVSIPDLLRTPRFWIADEVNYFLNHILENKEHMCTARDGKMALEVALGARRSAELHEKVVF